MMSSNLVSLTGSPAGKDGKDRRTSGGSKSRHGGSDMDMSDDEDGEIRDNILEEGFPPPQREQKDSWPDESGGGWENGDNSIESDYDHQRPQMPDFPSEGNGHFPHGPPPGFPGSKPGFNTPNSHRFPPNFHHGPPPRPPPPFRPPGSLLDQSNSDVNPTDANSGVSPFDEQRRGGNYDGPESSRGGFRGGFDGPRPRSGFDDLRGGFGGRGGFDGPRFPSHRFNSPQGPGRGGFSSERFNSPMNNFSDSGPGRGDGDRYDSDRGVFDSPRGRGGFRGGFHKNYDSPSDFEGSRGGRGGRGGWNGARRPWGTPRGRRGHW